MTNLSSARRVSPPFGARALRVAVVLLVAMASCDPGHDDAVVRDAEVAGAPAAATPEKGAPAIPSRRDELRDFRAALRHPGRLTGGAASPDDLARRWVSAVEQHDSAAFRSLLLTRAEFAFLYYPSSPLGRPPYDLSPQLMWFQLIGNSEQGLRDALEAFGGKRVGYLGVRCAAPEPQGENRFHGDCVVRRRRQDGSIIEQRLFGAMLEREGRFKFVSFANRL